MNFSKIMLNTRYLILPFCIVLILGIVLLMIQSVTKLFYLFSNIGASSDKDVLIGLFGIIDLALLANILLLIALSGYDSFIGRLNNSENNVMALDALDGLTLAKVKLKLLGSMIIISAIGLLSTFLSLGAGSADLTKTAIIQIAIHLALSLSAVLLAYSDKLDKS